MRKCYSTSYKLILKGITSALISENGAWCFLIVDRDNKPICKDYGFNVPGTATTSNRMTLIALIEAVKLLDKKEVRIEVFTDSIHLLAVIHQKAKRLDEEMTMLIDKFTSLRTGISFGSHLIREAPDNLKEAFHQYMAETEHELDPSIFVDGWRTVAFSNNIKLPPREPKKKKKKNKPKKKKNMWKCLKFEDKD